MKKFSVNYTISGRASAIIMAESKEEAEAKVDAEVNADDFDMDLDEIYSVDTHIQEMHPVTRGGKEIWTTYIMPDDVRGHRSALDTAPLFAAAAK